MHPMSEHSPRKRGFCLTTSHPQSSSKRTPPEFGGISSCPTSAACNDGRQLYATSCQGERENERVPHQHHKPKESPWNHREAEGSAWIIWEISALFRGLAARLRFACTRWCRVNWSGRENVFPQSGSSHTYGRTPVCVRSCVAQIKTAFRYKSESSDSRAWKGLMTRKMPCHRFVYQIGAEKSLFPHLPFAIFALEGFFAHVCPPVDGKCPSDGEGLSTTRVVARIRLW